MKRFNVYLPVECHEIYEDIEAEDENDAYMKVREGLAECSGSLTTCYDGLYIEEIKDKKLEKGEME